MSEGGVTRKKKSPLYVAVKSVFGLSMETNAVSFWGTGLLGQRQCTENHCRLFPV